MQGGLQHAREVVSKSQQLSWSTEQAAMCWVKSHEGLRPLPPFPQERCNTGTTITLSPLPLITMLQPSPTTTSFGPPKQSVHTSLFHRLSLLLGLPAGEPLLRHVKVGISSRSLFCYGLQLNSAFLAVERQSKGLFPWILVFSLLLHSTYPYCRSMSKRGNGGEIEKNPRPGSRKLPHQQPLQVRMYLPGEPNEEC